MVLVGGLVVVGMALSQVVSTPTDLSSEAGPWFLSAEATDESATGWIGNGEPAPAVEAIASLRVPTTGLVQHRAAAPEVEDDPQGQASPNDGSTAAWTEQLAALDDAALAAELPAIFAADGDPNQQVAGLKVSLGRGSELATLAVTAALQLPDVERTGAVSLPAHTIAQLEERAADSGLRSALEAAAWDLSLAPRLRGRAVASLASTATGDQLRVLHDQLYRERDAQVLASALGAARGGSMQLRLALADLFPDEDLTASRAEVPTSLHDQERLAL